MKMINPHSADLCVHQFSSARQKNVGLFFNPTVGSLCWVIFQKCAMLKSLGNF